MLTLVLSVQAESGRAVPLFSVLRPVTEDEGLDSLLVSFPQILLRAITAFLRNKILLLIETRVQKWFVFVYLV